MVSIAAHYGASRDRRETAPWHEAAPGRPHRRARLGRFRRTMLAAGIPRRRCVPPRRSDTPRIGRTGAPRATALGRPWHGRGMLAAIRSEAVRAACPASQRDRESYHWAIRAWPSPISLPAMVDSGSLPSRASRCARTIAHGGSCGQDRPRGAVRRSPSVLAAVRRCGTFAAGIASHSRCGIRPRTGFGARPGPASRPSSANNLTGPSRTHSDIGTYYLETATGRLTPAPSPSPLGVTPRGSAAARMIL